MFDFVARLAARIEAAAEVQTFLSLDHYLKRTLDIDFAAAGPSNLRV